MKATLIVIQDDAEHADAKALVEKLMSSSDPGDLACMTAQARLIEAYERVRWPRRAPSLPELLKYLMDQHGLTRSDLVPLLGTDLPAFCGPFQASEMAGPLSELFAGTQIG